MKNAIYIICITLALTACNTNNLSENKDTPVNKPEEFFSSEVNRAISSLMKRNCKNVLGQKHIYSLFIKNYSNMSTIFLIQEQYVDSSKSRLADGLELRGDTALLIYIGLRNAIGGLDDNNYHDTLKAGGYPTEWNEKIYDMSGSILHVFDGKVIKIDSIVSASQNVIYSDTPSFKFNKKEK